MIIDHDNCHPALGLGRFEADPQTEMQHHQHHKPVGDLDDVDDDADDAHVESDDKLEDSCDYVCIYCDHLIITHENCR